MIYEKKVLSVWAVFWLLTIAEVRNSMLALGDALLIDYISRETILNTIYKIWKKKPTIP